jgi:hypothetical protein
VLETLILPPLLNLKKDNDHFVFDFAWNKIYKTEIIRSHNIRFDEDKRTWEDRTFLLRHLKHCQNYYCMDRYFYNYFYTPNSLSQRYTPDYFRIILANFRHYHELFEDLFDFNTQYVCDYWSNAIEKMIFLSLAQTDNQSQIRQNIIDTLLDEFVIHWFSRRNCITDFEKTVSRFIAHGDCTSALTAYEKEYIIRQKQQKLRNFKSRIKAILEKLIGR